MPSARTARIAFAVATFAWALTSVSWGWYVATRHACPDAAVRFFDFGRKPVFIAVAMTALCGLGYLAARRAGRHRVLAVISVAVLLAALLFAYAGVGLAYGLVSSPHDPQCWSLF
jgi:hypothetical protein